MLSEQQIVEIRRRHEESTPGGWTVINQTEVLASHVADDGINGIVVVDTMFFSGKPTEQQRADAQFIANAHQDIPALLAVIDAWALVVEAARELRTYFRTCHEDENGCMYYNGMIGAHMEPMVSLLKAVARLEE